MTKDNDGNYELINYVIADNGGYNFTSGNIPVIIASNDSNYALGVVPQEMPDEYGLYNFLGMQPDSNACTKWNVQYKKYNISAKTIFHFTSYLCVGTLDDVKNCMVNIYTKL
eukprot:457455_1